MGSNEEQIFKKYFPQASVPYCLALWARHNIQFTISKPRKSVYGNYMHRAGIHAISVNGDLRPEAFLVTYLHEVAHLLVHVNSKKRRLPHGIEWQSYFRELLKPMIESGVFEAKVALRLWQHLQSPKATSCADPELHKLLMENETEDEQKGTSVSSLQPGQIFIYDSRTFKAVRKLRTRTECIELDRSAVYRFHPNAKVRIVEADAESEFSSKRPIHHLPIGATFRFGQKSYQMKEKRRTRFLCEDLSDKKLYLINQMMQVEPLKLESN